MDFGFSAADFTFSSVGERRKSKKCSVFHTITENEAVKDLLPTDYSQRILENTENVMKIRKKSSKKVSIAENLNCDYSDVSDLNEEETLGYEETCLADGEESCLADLGQATGHTVKARVEKFLLNMIFLILFMFFKMVHILYHFPVIITVILAILVMINFYLNWPFNTSYPYFLI